MTQLDGGSQYTVTELRSPQPDEVGAHLEEVASEGWELVNGSTAWSWARRRIAGRFLHPLRAMNTAARDISATNLHRRLHLDGPDDELTELGRTLDDLFARLEAAFQSQRRFIANASHELRTPLAAQRTLLQVAVADPEATAASLRAAGEEALLLGDQQHRLIDALLTLATSEQGLERRRPLDLAELAEPVLESRRHEATRAGVDVTASLESAPTTGDADLLESLIANLLDNAIRYNAPGGTVTIMTEQDGGAARLSVTNSGPVVPAGDINRLLRPFQRGGTARTGPRNRHGLGLAIVQAVADAHDAALTINPNDGGGLDVAVTITRPAPGPSEASNGQ